MQALQYRLVEMFTGIDLCTVESFMLQVSLISVNSTEICIKQVKLGLCAYLSYCSLSLLTSSLIVVVTLHVFDLCQLYQQCSSHCHRHHHDHWPTLAW